MKFKKAYLAAGATLALALFVSACGSDSGGSGGGGDDTITVAVAGPMTGDNGIYGQDQLSGVQFAAKEINDSGGIPDGPLKGKKIKVVKFDDVADPNQGASVAQKICDDTSIMAVFGHSNSSVTLAAEPIYERCGVPLFVSYSSNPEITAELHENLFRTLIDDAKMGSEMASFSHDQLGFKKVGVIASDDDYGDGLKTNFNKTAEEIGLDVAKTVTTSAKQKDFTPQLTELRNAGADSLVLLNTYTDAALQIKQADAMGWDVPIFVTPGSNSPELVKIAGEKAAEGTIVAAVFDPNSSEPGPAKFVNDFTAANGKGPGESAAMSYDSFYVFLTSLEKGAKDRKSVIEKSAEIGTFTLPIRGELMFNETHEPTVVPGKPAQILLQVKDGQIGSYAG
ncbi:MULTISPECIES: ABC transporter substrate-binding protein [unclassified Nocardioides]|uniref:ABC transporter substrate-binding protein n=1 Tax=unclassified Nocardioides TaxID=2615069 RepID=UPI0000570E46|nr:MULTISPECIES: ABC transporter substrate-binding protein [unclassified Nocardioides]ABL81353.1 amino acid/amide ABC transporter substrate-binding protein, HAAT family [Nocardioides sp. JS614]